MDITSAIGTLGSDYVNKVTSAMKDNATLKTTGTTDSDTTFDAIYDSVSFHMWQFSLHNLRSILSALPHNPDFSLK